LLFIARDPLARAESAYREYHHSWHHTAAPIPPFEVDSALAQIPDIIDDCRYGARLAHYATRLPRDQVHVLFFEDLLRDPETTLRACYTFLGVDADAPVSSVLPRLNPGGNKLRDTPALRAKLDLEADRNLALGLHILTLRERDQIAVPLGLREPHPPELSGWNETAQRRFAREIEPDIHAFLDATGRDLDIWPRFARLCVSSAAP